MKKKKHVTYSLKKRDLYRQVTILVSSAIVTCIVSLRYKSRFCEAIKSSRKLHSLTPPQQEEVFLEKEKSVV